VSPGLRGFLWGFALIALLAIGMDAAHAQTEPPPFDPETWLRSSEGAAQFGGFFGAGFIVVGMAHALGWAVGAILSLIER
jgi:hypothetical protein